MHPPRAAGSIAKRPAAVEVAAGLYPAVAVLEFLARAARAGGIARRAGPGRTAGEPLRLAAVGVGTAAARPLRPGRKGPPVGAGGAGRLGQRFLGFGEDIGESRLGHLQLDMRE